MYMFLNHNYIYLSENNKLSKHIDFKEMDKRLEMILNDNSNACPERRIIRNFVIWSVVRGFNLTYIYEKAHYFAKANHIPLIEMKSIYYKTKYYLRDKDYSMYVSKDWDEDIYQFPVLYNKGREWVERDRIPTIINQDENSGNEFTRGAMKLIMHMASSMYFIEKSERYESNINDIKFDKPKEIVIEESAKIDLLLSKDDKIESEKQEDAMGMLLKDALSRALEIDDRARQERENEGDDCEEEEYEDNYYDEYGDDADDMRDPGTLEDFLARSRADMEETGLEEDDIVQTLKEVELEFLERKRRYEEQMREMDEYEANQNADNDEENCEDED